MSCRDSPRSGLCSTSPVTEFSLLQDCAALATLLLKIVRIVCPDLGSVCTAEPGGSDVGTAADGGFFVCFSGCFFGSICDFVPQPYEWRIDYSESLL